MNKRELISAIASKLRDNDVKKPVTVKKHKFFISDEDGNRAEFDIKQEDKNVLFTVDDVGAFVDAALEVIEESLRSGLDITIKGFGSLRLHRRAARRTKQPGTEDWYEVEERLVPKFFYGNRLRMAARSYELIRDDNDAVVEDPIFDEDEL